MRQILWIAAFGVGCGEIPEACPVGELIEGDVPCDCAGTVVEDLSCGSVICGEDGVAALTTSTDCTSSTTSDQ